MKLKKGVYTVLVTPFKPDGTIDYESYQNLLNKQVESDITGIVLLGTTSESPTLGFNEEKNLIIMTHTFIKDNSSNLDIIIGVGGNNTIKTLEFALFCKNYCDGLMVTTPNYNKPGQDGIYEHFKLIANNAEICNKPILMYNIPSRCGVNIEPKTVAKIFNNCKNVVAIKEASGSISQAIDIKNLCDIDIFSGDDSLIIPIISIGGKGVISVASNIIPDIISKLVKKCLNNDFEQARNIYYNFHNFIKMLFIKTNPVPIKEILFQNNIIACQNVRLPLVTIKEIYIKEDLKIVYKEALLNYRIKNNYVNSPNLDKSFKNLNETLISEI